MTRLIDADALIDHMIKTYCKYNCERWCRSCWVYDATDEFENAPTVDPVKHGHWLRPKGKGYGVCSNCGMNRVDLLDGYEHNYCEVCGAKMEGVEEV